MDDDIFGVDDPVQLPIRFSQPIINRLKKYSDYSFRYLKSLLNEKELSCFFCKVDEQIHRVMVWLPKQNCQITLTIKWNVMTFDYSCIITDSNSIVNQGRRALLVADEYTINETCRVLLIKEEDACYPEKRLQLLYRQIEALPITSQIKLESHKEIWSKWIEAQKIILNKNAEPISIQALRELTPILKSDGTIWKYQLRATVQRLIRSEYKELSARLAKDPFYIKDAFKTDAVAFLKWDDIKRGLDNVIAREYSSMFERKPAIACILKIRPISTDKVLNERLGNKYTITSRFNQQQVMVELGTRLKEVEDACTQEGFTFDKYLGVFNISNHGNILLNEAINTKYAITFGNSFEKELNQREYLLPIPTNNQFKIWGRSASDLARFYQSLSRIYGAKNVDRTCYLVYKKAESTQQEFDTENFWHDLKRDFYMLDFDVSVSRSDNTIAFDFQYYEELKQRVEALLELKKFDLVYSPLEMDFKFKVQVDLLATKNKDEIYLERLKYLHGTSFQITKEKDKPLRSNNLLTIGNLNAYSSDLKTLVFELPQWQKEDKKAAKDLLAFLEGEELPQIDKIYPNLKGEQSKISWLNEAMTKINNPQEYLDGKPVNAQLSEVIFDSSKAEKIYADLDEGGERWRDVERHELLSLNKFQRQAVLSAVYAPTLALLQGPPGTGKTTVIAEIIWQMIRQDQHQKILLTSETNLAVDNALEKLLNDRHTLVKPLRFGRVSKFEEEGKKYAASRIESWIHEGTQQKDTILPKDELLEEGDAITQEDNSNNCVQLWMNRIATNSQRNSSKYAEVLKEWTFEMVAPTQEMKLLFKNKYFKYANVIGSTSSSAGSPRFGAEYHRIFAIATEEESAQEMSNRYRFFRYKKDQKTPFVNNRHTQKLQANLSPIVFDAVITDEASKATPPELLLPMCFGKKNIVIGDHRQLPPMLHDKDFIETLESLDSPEAHKLAQEIDKKFVKTSQFERLIMNRKISPTIKSTFNWQYRMHPKINDVIKQFYLDEGGLEPAPPLLEHCDNKNLSHPFSRTHGLSYPGFIREDVHTIWVDVTAPEMLSGTSRINETEVEAVQLVLELLSKCEGFDAYMNHWEQLKDAHKEQEAKEIGLITFYGHQVKKLKTVARYAQKQLNLPTRLNTVDKFQGMERNIIIVSTVRSHQIQINGKVSKNRDIGFAKSPQRLNVALSRARRLLIVVGNKSFFESYQDKKGQAIYNNVINNIAAQGMVIPYEQLKKIAAYE